MHAYSLNTASSSCAHDRDDRRVIGEELPSRATRAIRASSPRFSPLVQTRAQMQGPMARQVGTSPPASPNLMPIPLTGDAAYVIRETRSETYLLAAEWPRRPFPFADPGRPRPSGLTREFHGEGGGGGGRDGSFKFFPQRPPPHFSRLWNLSSTRDIPRGTKRREGR